jgi:hypothetical protein
MRSLIVVATAGEGAVNRFQVASLREARNMKDFLEQTGEFRAAKIYELDKSIGPLRQWAELLEAPQ